MSLERWVIGTLLFVMVFVAVPAEELFPLSNAPMFAAVYREFWIYRLTDNDGKQLSLELFGLRSNPNWYLEDYYAVQHSPNHVSPPSVLPTIDTLLKHIQAVGEREGASFPLLLEVKAIGDGGKGRVGITQKRSWIIERAS